MERGDYEVFRPLANIQEEEGPIEFNAPGTADLYTDLGRTKLLLRVKLTTTDNKALANDAPIAPTNNFLHSLFSQVDFKINETLVSPSTNTYAYKSYLETLLSHGAESKDTWLNTELFYKDTGDFEIVDVASDDCSLGFKERASVAASSRVFEMYGRPHLDMLHTDRYLLNGVGMNFKFIRSPKAFHIMGDSANVRVKILAAELHVRRVKINPTISLQHTQTMNGGVTAKYPIRRGVVLSFTIPQGNQSFIKESLTQGQQPRRAFGGIVNNSAFNGTGLQNPFNFLPHGLDYLVMNTGGQSFPSQPLRPDFAAGNYVQAFHSLYQAAGLDCTGRGMDVDYADFARGYAIYGFDFTADMSEGAHVDPVKYGNLCVEGHFSAPLTRPVNFVLYLEFDNVVQIDRARNVITDFASV